ncbi:AAA family ATPase [Streptomyces brasiliensis]|uniref:AAA family ATPase n=1 Tax=Streptomyces brasiliensis TaxID=1954 RepID=UPI003570F7E3
MSSASPESGGPDAPASAALVNAASADSSRPVPCVGDVGTDAPVPAPRSASSPLSVSTAPSVPSVEVREGPLRPCLTELRLSAFAGHRRAGFPLGPLTLFAGPSGCGKSTALRAYEALARLGAGAPLVEALPDPVACVPDRARPDAQRRRGFRIGCTVDGPEGPVRLDVAVQVEPELRIVGERLTASGLVLLETALRDPGRRAVQAAWHTAGTSPVTRAPLPDDRLGTALLPLRVAGKTDGQRRVLAAAEQTVVALRTVFACDPRPERMREPVLMGSGRLLPGCDNLADVLWRTRAECARRHAQLVTAVQAGCAGRVTDLVSEPAGDGTVRAMLDRGDGTRTDLGRLGDGELRYLALALVLLTGPGVLDVDVPGEVPDAIKVLTVLADGLDRALDPRQRTELLRLAARMCTRGHIRFVGAVSDASWTGEVPGVTVVHLDA